MLFQLNMGKCQALNKEFLAQIYLYMFVMLLVPAVAVKRKRQTA